MANLLDDLLDVSRITQGKIVLRREPCELAAICREAIEVVSPMAEVNGQELTLEGTDVPVWIDADRSRLLQIVENLLVNAVKYTPGGGHVRATVGCEGNRGSVVVVDDGRGIPPEQLDRIFDMFVQGDASLDRSDGGMGVGLTLVRDLVDLHGGTIEARSEGTGRGSRFEVRFPLTNPPVRVVDDAQPPAVDPSTVRVVLVEDNSDSREMLRTLLELEGFPVETAGDGRSGLELIVERRPNVALVDIGLPEVDGYQVARRVRETIDRRSVRLIALTGYGLEEDREAVLESGFDHHLVKPVDVQNLRSVLLDDGRTT